MAEEVSPLPCPYVSYLYLIAKRRHGLPLHSSVVLARGGCVRCEVLSKAPRAGAHYRQSDIRANFEPKTTLNSLPSALARKMPPPVPVKTIWEPSGDQWPS